MKQKSIISDKHFRRLVQLGLQDTTDFEMFIVLAYIPGIMLTSDLMSVQTKQCAFSLFLGKKYSLYIERMVNKTELEKTDS